MPYSLLVPIRIAVHHGEELVQASHLDGISCCPDGEVEAIAHLQVVYFQHHLARLPRRENHIACIRRGDGKDENPVFAL